MFFCCKNKVLVKRLLRFARYDCEARPFVADVAVHERSRFEGNGTAQKFLDCKRSVGFSLLAFETDGQRRFAPGI